MQRLVELSLEHRLVVVLLAVLLVAAGWMSFRSLPIDAFPDVTNVQVTVISQAATLSPLEIEQLLTYPIEQACTGLPHSTEVRSLSKFGLSMVTVVFEDGTDIYFARQLVLERIFSVQGDLPEGASSGSGADLDRSRRGLPVHAGEPRPRPDGSALAPGLGPAADPPDRTGRCRRRQLRR